jgi:phi13 family phage major tail protein
MTINAAEYKSTVGLDSLYYALVTADELTGITFGTPAYLAPAADLSLSNNANSETQYADDGAFDIAMGEGSSDFTINITNLPPEVEAAITGQKFDSTTGRIWDDGDPASAPDVAFGFRSKKSNGSYRYFWFLKGKFMKPSNEFATQGDTPDPKNVTLEYKAVRTVYKYTVDALARGFKRVFGDADTDNFSASGWFTSVQEPTEDS